MSVLFLKNGPLDGVIHELHGGLMPAKVGLLTDEQTELHWYAVVGDDTAVYESSETINESRDWYGYD